MSTAQLSQEQELGGNTAVNLLFMCDFPPSNLAGGSILMSRLLQDYPPDRITVLASSRYLHVSPERRAPVLRPYCIPHDEGLGPLGTRAN